MSVPPSPNNIEHIIKHQKIILFRRKINTDLRSLTADADREVVMKFAKQHAAKTAAALRPARAIIFASLSRFWALFLGVIRTRKGVDDTDSAATALQQCLHRRPLSDLYTFGLARATQTPHVRQYWCGGHLDLTSRFIVTEYAALADCRTRDYVARGHCKLVGWPGNPVTSVYSAHGNWANRYAYNVREGKKTSTNHISAFFFSLRTFRFRKRSG